jgi:hypothetical protein
MAWILHEQVRHLLFAYIKLVAATRSKDTSLRQVDKVGYNAGDNIQPPLFVS